MTIRCFNSENFFIHGISLLALILLTQLATAQTNDSRITSNQKWIAPAWADTLRNPYKYDESIIDSGKMIYKKQCVVCHGNTGKGDGVAAVGLMVKPADHTSAVVQSQSDGALFYKLSNGRLPMPAWKYTLTKKQRWALVAYIRTLDKTTTTNIKK